MEVYTKCLLWSCIISVATVFAALHCPLTWPWVVADTILFLLCLGLVSVLALPKTRSCLYRHCLCRFMCRGCCRSCLWCKCRRCNYVGLPKKEMVCLGRRFKLGMLYSSLNDSLFPSAEKNLWTKWNIKKYTRSTLHENSANIHFDIFTDDSFSGKLHNLGIEGHFALNLLGGLVKTSSSTDYLQDTILSKRQVRVVLRYQCVTKYKELNLAESVKCFHDDNVASHIVVGMEYGTQAYFVFDKEVGKDEDYKGTCRQMESLISYLPDFARKKQALNEKEKALSKQLQYTLYSDISILSRNLQSFEEAVEICGRILPGFAAMGAVSPIKAWLCPLTVLTPKQNVSVEQTLIDQLLKTIDRLHYSELKVNYWLDDKVCHSFNCLFDQLEIFWNVINQNRLSLCNHLQKLVPQIQKQSKKRKLKNIISKVTNQSIRIENFLDAKEKEMYQISEYLTLLKSAGKHNKLCIDI